MRKFKTGRPRALPFRLLLFVVGALLFMAALVPRANAFVIVYFNFEHPTPGNDPDFFSRTIGPPDFNPGGGTVFTQLQTSFTNFAGTSPGIPLNVTAGDSDPNNFKLGLRTTPVDNGGWLQFSLNATPYFNMALSFAVNSAGNGFNSVTLQYSTTGPGGPFVNVGTMAIAPGPAQVISFTLPPAVDHQASLTLRLVFTGGTSMGNNLQTQIDNIQLVGVPEPTTVVGGLLGVLGLGWYQRRRLVRSVRFRRASG